MTSTAPGKHRRHPWSAIREYRTPDRPPRHAKDRLLERLGAHGFDIDELMRQTFIGNPFRGAR